LGAEILNFSAPSVFMWKIWTLLYCGKILIKILWIKLFF